MTECGCSGGVIGWLLYAHSSADVQHCRAVQHSHLLHQPATPSTSLVASLLASYPNHRVDAPSQLGLV